MIYLDHQASTPMTARAIDALTAACKEQFANPHSEDHLPGWSAADALEEARWQIASHLAADADEIVFVSGATEANNIALLGAAAEANGGRIVVGEIEHDAVLAPARELARRGYDVVAAPVTPEGVIDVGRFEELLLPGTIMASVMLVNNEIGTVQPIERIAALCRARGVILHVDAAQALAWMPIDVEALGADLLSVSGHKAGGPKGIGALYVGREAAGRLRPIAFGGGQEKGMRPGTVPTPLCASFAAALRDIPDAGAVAAWRARTDRFRQRLLDMVEGARSNGGGHPGNVSLTLPKVDADLLISRLRPRIAVSRGSACSSGIHSHSHVLRAIGLSAADCGSTIRIGTGCRTSDEELDHALEAFREAIAGCGGISPADQSARVPNRAT